jgi:hypothetical protein
VPPTPEAATAPGVIFLVAGALTSRGRQAPRMMRAGVRVAGTRAAKSAGEMSIVAERGD